MIWGAFDDFIIAEIPAKELRAQVRRRGIITASDAEKGRVLRRYVEDYLRQRAKGVPDGDALLP